MKKFFAKLIGWREQRNPSHFQQQEEVERSLAEERRRDAMVKEQERIKDNMKKRQEPSEVEILGPSDSAPKEKG